MGYRIGIDVGGTFTDFVLLKPDGGTRVQKVLSTPADPSEAVLKGLGNLAQACSLSLEQFLSEVDIILHGTTVTTNAVLTGKVARTGLLTNWGFRDALEMRRGIREEFYNNKFTAPPPLVPRRLRLPVRGRMDHTGREVEPLNLDDVDGAIGELKSQGVTAIAICFMHSYANPAHEEAAAKLVADRMPEAYLSVSSRIIPQVRFYERASTTVLNSVVGPVLKKYMESLRRRLSVAGFDGVLRIMQSNGGVTSPEAVAALAASTLLSGPAAAPTAGLAAMQPHGVDGFITVDMGGTSFDAAMVVGGKPSITTTGSVNRFALALPSMEIITIGAGGGSIAWIDDGLLRMGPQSAGAAPGPACYGKGGSEPTCSDANLVLGYLSPTFFAGGQLALDVEAARIAIRERVAEPLAMDPVHAAYGMYKVMNVNMASAIREISVQKGWDPREFPLICAGGAGAVHAAMIARELGIRRIVVPRDAAIFCAFGMLGTDLKHDFVRSQPMALGDGADSRQLALLVDQMAREADAVLASEGIAPPDRRLMHSIDLRYLGQYHEVSVETSAEQLKEGRWNEITDAFHDRHDQLYGYALREAETVVELVSVRISALGITDKPPARNEPRTGSDSSHLIKGYRDVFQPGAGQFARTPVYDGDALRNGNELTGPAIVEKVTTTIFVPSGFALAVDSSGGFVLEDQSTEELV